MTHWFLEEESSSTNILLLFSLSYYALTSLSSYIIDHSSWYSCFQLVLSIVIFVIIISNPSPFTGIYPLRCPSLRRLLPYLSPFPSIVGTFLQIYNSKFFLGTFSKRYPKSFINTFSTCTYFSTRFLICIDILFICSDEVGGYYRLCTMGGNLLLLS